MRTTIVEDPGSEFLHLHAFQPGDVVESKNGTRYFVVSKYDPSKGADYGLLHLESFSVYGASREKYYRKVPFKEVRIQK